jgi:hypothetical protein
MPSLDPALFPNALLVEACDIPVDMTLGEWRRRRAATARPRRRLLFWRYG